MVGVAEWLRRQAVDLVYVSSNLTAYPNLHSGEAMNIDLRSWHGRLYQFWYGMKHQEDIARDWLPKAPATTDLCRYMRVVLFHWWLRYLFLSGRIPGLKRQVPLAVVIVPFLMIELPRWAGIFSFGLKQFLLTVDIGLLCLVLLVGIIVGIELLDARQEKKSKAQSSSFVTVTMAWIKAKKQRICPIIRFE
jgi:hypothetical protein